MKSKSLGIITVAVAAFALIVLAVMPMINVSEPVVTAQASAATDWQPTYNGSYYDGIDETKSGKALRDDLASLITTTHRYETSYNELKTVFNTTDKNPNGSGILLFYTGTQVASYSAAGANREHVWAKRAGKAFNPYEAECGSDAHHLRPTDTTLNSTRSNYPFDEVTASSPAKGDSNNGTNPCYLSGGYFYPGKGYRGATARILFYVQTRWGNKNSLFLADDNLGDKGQGKLSTLMKWHLEEPPTAAEILRNEEVFKIQGNRNPFIDHPEYASKIFCHTNGLQSIDGTTLGNRLVNVVSTYGDYNGNAVELESIRFNENSYELTVGQSVSLSVTGTPSNANASVTYASLNTNVAKIENGKLVAVGAGECQIVATSTQNSNITATATVTVKAVTGLEVEGTCKTVYNVGDTFDPTGLTVKLIYSDGTSQTVANNLCSWLDGSKNTTSLAKGTTTVKCSYQGQTYVITGITVRAVESITVEGTATNTVYGAGQTFIPEGLTVTAHFSDGTTEVIPNDQCSWLDQNGSKTFTSVSTRVKCIYNGVTCDENDYIVILIKQVAGITVTGTLNKTAYMVGETFDPAGLTVTQEFNDGSTINIPVSACQWLDELGNATAASTSTKLVCKYGSYTANVNAALLVKMLKEVVVSGTPTKTTYLLGNSIVTTGLTVTLHFTNGDTTEILASYCRWVDNNNSETIKSNSTSIHCEYVYGGVKFVSNAISGIKVSLSASMQEFINSVEAISQKETAEEKFQLIKTAAEAYEQLSEAEKEAVKEAYNNLLNAINDYNTKADTANDGFAHVIETAVFAASQSVIALIAALYILGKRS